MASLLATGGAGTIANTSSSAAMITLYERQDTSGVAVDGGACDAYSVCNTGTTNGVTASTDWLYVHVDDMHVSTQAVPLLPGERMVFKLGFNGNGLIRIKAYTRAAGGGSGAAGNVQVAGGFQGKN